MSTVAIAMLENHCLLSEMVDGAAGRTKVPVVAEVVRP